MSSGPDISVLKKLAGRWRGAIPAVRQQLSRLTWSEATWRELEELLADMTAGKAAANLLVAVLAEGRERDCERAASLGDRVIDRLGTAASLQALILVHLRLGDVDRAARLLEQLPDDEWKVRTRERMKPAPGRSAIEAGLLGTVGHDNCGEVADHLIVGAGDQAWVQRTIAGLDGDAVHLLDLRSTSAAVDGVSKLFTAPSFGLEDLEGPALADAIEALDGWYGGYRAIHARGAGLAELLASRKSLYRRVRLADIAELTEPLASDVRSTCLAAGTSKPARAGRRIVVASHDLKFAGELESMLKATGHTVIRDRWGYSRPLDLGRTRRLAEWAEVVFCEWGLANASWYSRHLAPNKRLVVRIHLQEVFGRGLEHARRIDHRRVDSFVLVADELAEPAGNELGWPAAKLRVIPNYVNTAAFRRDKRGEAAFRIAIIGVSPRRKRLDRALDTLAKVREHEPRFSLVIKGSHPLEHSWVADREDQCRYFEEQLKRIDADPLLDGAVAWEGHSARLYDWYRGVGAVLSPSDFESFHYSVAEGAASGALPLVWPWSGAERTYGPDWLVADSRTAAERILDRLGDSFDPEREGQNATRIASRYDIGAIVPELARAIVG